jgi:hypothetical protein
MFLNRPEKPDWERREEDPEEAGRKHEQIWEKFQRGFRPIR